MYFDVFNGDADGIFALHQLRLARPSPEAALVTGVKRDISLLRKIPAGEPASITVLDVSLDKNRTELEHLLGAGCTVLYIDHHYAGEIPVSDRLTCHIEPSSDTCTSLIVNSLLEGKFAAWAICGAFGDNLHDRANEIASGEGLDEEQTAELRVMGELFNYNGYGAQLEDLHYNPEDLFRAVQRFSDPFEFLSQTDVVGSLQNGYDSDMQTALSYSDISADKRNRIYRFPAQSWARRVAGVFSNSKAREKKDAAHAIVIENDDSTFQISVRAPLVKRENADILCRRYPTGGGRAAAAGINNLPSDMLDQFLEDFSTTFTV